MPNGSANLLVEYLRQEHGVEHVISIAGSNVKIRRKDGKTLSDKIAKAVSSFAVELAKKRRVDLQQAPIGPDQVTVKGLSLTFLRRPTI